MKERSIEDLEAELARLLLRQERDRRKIHRVNSSAITVRGAKEEMSMRAPLIKKLQEQIAKKKAGTPS